METTRSCGRFRSATATVSVTTTSRTAGWSSRSRAPGSNRPCDDLGPRARFGERPEALGHGAARRHHVVHDQVCPARHVSDDVGHLGLAAALATLVQHDHRDPEATRVLGGHGHAPDIGRDHDGIGRQPIAQRPAERRHRGQAVDGNLKETLDLRRVQVHCDEVGDASGIREIGGHPPGNRLPATVPLVRRRVAEVGHDRGDARSGRTVAGIGQRQQLDQTIVDRRRGRLHEKDLLAAHRLQQLHRHLAVRGPVERGGSNRHAQLARSLPPAPGWPTGKDRDLSAHATL
jgi:hypothetical protein